jgi:hypothetical protein
MAEQYDDSIFTGIFNALKRGGKDKQESEKEILTNSPTSNPFASKQQKQQQFLDIQSKKISDDLYTRSMYYEADRFTAYQDYRAMDNSPEVSAALDILSDECVTKNERGEILGIYSDNSRVKNTLKDLFYNTLNINYNLGFWTRELLKFGDTFLKLEIDQDSGIFDVIMLPVGEIHRVENKKEQIGSSTFKWDVNNLTFEEWQVAHFRLISDSNRLPYGRSILEPARKLWRQLQLAEDAMLVYRAVRAPERRVYYIEVGNIDPADVPQYMERAKASVKKTPMVNPTTQTVDLKFAPMTYEEDYFLPVRGDKSSRIETLPGASNLGDIADIEYLQNKLFAALKVPKPYLNYAETIPGGSALSQADLRFSRTINRLQQFLVIELRRIANIHLYFLGFEDEINNFEITLTNPSTQQELLKLETMKARLEVFKELFTNDPTSPVSYTWAMQYIMGFSETEIKQILRQKKIERKMFSEIEGAADEYNETGIFNDLDRKFRKQGWVPGQGAGGEGGAEGGADAGGGGSSLGGLGGGLDMGGGADLGGDMSGADAGADVGADVGADAGADAGAEPLAENVNQGNKLQKNNAAVNHRTKMLMENIEKHLKSLDEKIGDKNSDNLIID